MPWSPKRTMHKIVCKGCGNIFATFDGYAVCCSSKCAGKVAQRAVKPKNKSAGQVYAEMVAAVGRVND